MGSNAVIGYKQMIDDEGSKSQWVVIRGYGTAIFLDKNLTEQEYLSNLRLQNPSSLVRDFT